MGMFDSLIIECPECGKNIEFQSKAGDCVLDVYGLDNCPASILGDLANETETCECGRVVTMKVQIRASIE